MVDRRRDGRDLDDGRRRARLPRNVQGGADLEAFEQGTSSNSSHLAPFHSSSYYGLGLLVNNGWQIQNPFIDGYTGLAAYLPSQDLSVGIVTTQLPQSSNNEVGYASELFAQLAAYLGHEVKF
jgi:D-alanyl-D-alanine carboxypeptidase